ncbi:3-oxoadipate enol-lactonase [Boseongicola aestuarii]|uniref:3-oxoadipate enol-lactonase 2 n=1 Tax=Boseongicola aestuarii TaxID=1470561 RepID=A0A238IZM6_9RHOB|nr:3-oxoadipate enol-lactonase [Boseongicola aestuarii]SMX23938.1 3-oxoadipate enol-lactonase 2 [Boseongicola aestuarii]
MNVLDANGIAIHWREDGDASGLPVVFSNSLGTDLRLWDAVISQLPKGFRYIRFDNRGHGLTSVTPAPYTLDMLISDAEAVMDAVVGGPAIFVGLSIGGIIGQGLALKRPDLVKALFLSNTTARFGTVELWQDRIDQVEAQGLAAMSDSILDRWFSSEGRHKRETVLWRAMVERTPVDGYAGCSAALRDADLRDRVGSLNLPVFFVTGEEDGATPPDVVKATATLIPGARMEIIAGTGHLPCVEKSEAYAAILASFMKENSSD